MNPFFDDGNVILQFEDNSYHRVYQGILAAASPVFADMFLLPQPSSDNAQDVMDGCPVVRLPDSSKDWRYILKALFEPRFVTLLSTFWSWIAEEKTQDIPTLRRKRLNSIWSLLFFA
jgi:hypothetical protein